MKKIFFKNGFTLIELLIVVTIIMILASLVIMSVSKSRTTARDGKRRADLSQIQLALEMYKDSHGSYPVFTNAFTADDANANIVTGGPVIQHVLPTQLQPYLDPFPKDPLDHKSGFEYQVQTWNIPYNIDQPMTSYNIRARVEDTDNFKDFDFTTPVNNVYCYYLKAGTSTLRTDSLSTRCQ